MNLSFFIARRYLISKKSHNIINLISGISLSGVALGTAALIIVLSVFNGFESLVKSLFSVFDPDIKISIAEGKTFRESDLPMDKIYQLKGVAKCTRVVEENALLRYNKQQFIASIKGVDSLYQVQCPLDSLVVEGEMLLQTSDRDYAVPGYGIAYYLNLDMNDPQNFISVYIPKRTGKPGGIPDDDFNIRMIQPAGIFSVQKDFDDRYMLVPLRFAREMLDYTDELTSVEIRLKKGCDSDAIQKQIIQLAGNEFKVQNRFQQQETLYKIMKTEKWAVFLILTFILLVASFSIIGSLSMLIIDKKKDIGILNSMGAPEATIRRIFLLAGLLVSLSGATAGLILGWLVCFLQQTFGLIKLQTGDSFVVSAYPVQMNGLDFVSVFVTVFLIGLIAAWIPAYRIRKLQG